MPSTSATTYDQVPYDARPRYATHPDCLATLARLLGMNPAPVDRCRFLELGCSTGGNLFPLAESLPGSTFVGVDLSERQIDMGKQVVSALSLNNLRLEARGILDVEPSFGEFDYIVCHGVYSWVPPAVRDKILAICKANLAPQGVAYVSYNTYPGWYLRAGARDLMNFHTQGQADPTVKVQQARMILDFAAENAPDKEGTWGKVLKDEAELIRPEGDYYVFHEHLETENNPVYFTQFMENAARHGLQFLSEATMHTSLTVFSPEVQKVLRSLADDLIQLEQYLDFLKNRSFRRTLLVHGEVTLTRTPGPASAQTLLAVGMARPASEQPEIHSQKVEEFINDNGATVSTNAPFAKAALMKLYEGWPHPYTFDEMWASVSGLITDVPEEIGRGMLARSMVHLFLTGLVGLHTHVAPFTLTPGERPRTSALIRLKARTGATVSNFRHKEVKLETFDRAVLSLCDGERDRAAIVEELAALAAADKIGLKRDGRELTEPEEIRVGLREELQESLGRLARAVVLLG